MAFHHNRSEYNLYYSNHPYILLEDRVFHSIPINLTQALTQNVSTINGTAEQLSPQYNINNDTFISINDELKPKLTDQLRSALVVTQGEKCGLKPCPIWLKSQYSAIPNLDIISKVPFNTPILIMNGKNDSQTPIHHAVLLQQRLTEALAGFQIQLETLRNLPFCKMNEMIFWPGH